MGTEVWDDGANKWTTKRPRLTLISTYRLTNNLNRKLQEKLLITDIAAAANDTADATAIAAEEQ